MIKKVCAVLGVIVLFLVILFMIPTTKYFVAGSIVSVINISSYPFKPTFKVSKTYSGGSVGYECTKPIELKKTLRKVGHMGGSNYEVLYLPVNSSEAKSLCQRTWIE